MLRLLPLVAGKAGKGSANELSRELAAPPKGSALAKDHGVVRVSKCITKGIGTVSFLEL